MSAQAFSSAASTRSAAEVCTGIKRPAFDVFVERLARRLLAWSDRREAEAQPSHERMALLLENERSRRVGGSSMNR